jgi:adenosylcobinamide-GDP ribazoletransferase
MKNFRSAIRFLTVLPAGKDAEFDPPGMLPWFPLVGLLLGGLLALFDSFASRWWSPAAVAVLDVVLLAVLTGAFHLDGLGDAADGLFSHRPREKTLEIMKDSRIGAMGVVALACVLGLKWAGINGLVEHRALLLVLVPGYARGGILFAMRFLEYGRPGGGTGLPFFTRKLAGRHFWALAAAVLLSVGLGPMALRLNTGFVLLTAGVIACYKRRLGCVTGDMLGAMTEATEAGLLLIASMGGVR